MVAFSYTTTFLLNCNLQESPKLAKIYLCQFFKMYLISQWPTDMILKSHFDMVHLLTKLPNRRSKMNFWKIGIMRKIFLPGFTANLTTYNITELSKRTKGSNFTYHTNFSEGEAYLISINCASFQSLKIKSLKKKK